MHFFIMALILFFMMSYTHNPKLLVRLFFLFLIIVTCSVFPFFIPFFIGSIVVYFLFDIFARAYPQTVNNSVSFKHIKELENKLGQLGSVFLSLLVAVRTAIEPVR